MKLNITAVTVSMNYLERKKYSIKYLVIAYSKTGKAMWKVRHVGATGFDKTALQGDAFQYAFKNNVPYVRDVRQGQFITAEHKAQLKKYGVAVK